MLYFFYTFCNIRVIAMQTRAFIPNTGSNPGTVSVIKTDDNSLVATISLGTGIVNAGSVCVDDVNNCSKVYVSSQNLATGNQVSVINALTNTVAANIALSAGSANGLAVTPDKTRVYATTASGGSGPAVYMLDAATNLQAAVINTGSGDPQGIVITPDGNYAYVYCRGGATVKVIDVNPLSGTYNTVVATVAAVGAAGEGRGIAITPNGSVVYVTTTGTLLTNGMVKVISTASNTIIATITLPVGSGPRAVVIAPNGLLGYVTNNLNDTISIIDTNPASGTYNTVIATTSLSSGGGPSGVSITPQGDKTYAINSADSGVSVISATTPFAVSGTFTTDSAHAGIGIFIALVDVTTTTEPEKKNAVGVALPLEVCFVKLCYGPNGFIIPCDGINKNYVPCEQEIRYPHSRYGAIYEKYYDAGMYCCYRLKLWKR